MHHDLTLTVSLYFAQCTANEARLIPIPCYPSIRIHPLRPFLLLLFLPLHELDGIWKKSLLGILNWNVFPLLPNVSESIPNWLMLLRSLFLCEVTYKKLVEVKWHTDTFLTRRGQILYLFDLIHAGYPFSLLPCSTLLFAQNSINVLSNKSLFIFNMRYKRKSTITSQGMASQNRQKRLAEVE